MTNTEFKQFYGKHITEKRKAMGMSQEVCADEIGISKDALSRIERGINAPMFSTSLALDRLLQLDHDQIREAYKKYIVDQEESSDALD